MARTPLYPRGGDFTTWALNITQRMERDYAELKNDTINVASNIASVSAEITAALRSVSICLTADIAASEATSRANFLSNDASLSAVLYAAITSVATQADTDLHSVSDVIKADISSVSFVIKQDISSVAADIISGYYGGMVTTDDLRSVSACIGADIRTLSAHVYGSLSSAEAFVRGSLSTAEAYAHGSLSTFEALRGSLSSAEALVHGSLSSFEALRGSLSAAEALINGSLSTAEAYVRGSLSSFEALRASLVSSEALVHGSLSTFEALRGSLASAEALVHGSLSSAEAFVRGSLSSLEALVRDSLSSAEVLVHGSLSTAEALVRGSLSTAEAFVRDSLSSLEYYVRNTLSACIAGIISSGIGDSVSSAEVFVHGSLSTLEAYVRDTLSNTISVIAADIHSVSAVISSALEPYLVTSVSAGETAFVFSDFGYDSGTAARAYRRLHADNPGTHTNTSFAAFGIEYRPVGSGINGPTSADFGLNISVFKRSLSSSPTSAVTGELDGINIVMRQGGDHNDVGGWLANVAHYGTGYTAIFEGVAAILNTLSAVYQIRLQGGSMNNVTTSFFTGLNIIAEQGTFDHGLYISVANVASCGYARYISCALPEGTLAFTIQSDGSIVSKSYCNADGGFKVQGTQVVGSRATGWVPMAGPGNIDTTLTAAADISILYLSARVNSIQYWLTQHGLIGA